MAHWIVDDRGFGGTYWICSACKDSFCDLFHDVSSITEECPTCGSHMDEEAVEYLKEEVNKTTFITAKEARSKIMKDIENHPDYISIVGYIDNEICRAIEKRETRVRVRYTHSPTSVIFEAVKKRYVDLGYSFDLFEHPATGRYIVTIEW